ncbi:MAG: tRNA lysidine(34) synthetase TilS [Acidimicrobiales bacterium]
MTLQQAAAPLLPRCHFPPPGAPVVCAVSGGADSLALLALAVAAGCRAEAVHVDHGLRPGSHLEFAVVADAAATLDVPARSVRVEVAPGPNLEARARAARYAALPPGALTGHTADDQAETVLINLLRGAGSSGLAGMRADDRRPLLHLRRHDCRALVETLGWTPVADPSNDDPRFVRNRVRHELLPLLDAIAGRDLAPVLARQAALLRDESDLLDELARALDPTDARALAAAPPPLARRAVRRWLTDTDPERHPPDAATVERVLDVATGRALGTDVGAGRQVRRRDQLLRLEPPESSPAARSAETFRHRLV